MSDAVEQRDGMLISWDVPIPMDDGAVLRADVYRPPAEGRYPALVTYGPYGKGLTFPEGYPDAWKRLVTTHPEAAEGTSGRYTAWETPDPEKWVPDGYAVVRVDARGWGRSPGFVDPYSARGTRDFYQCIEWAGTQPWCNSKVGLLGISYYAITQWLVAGLQPPHLAAIVPWEGLGDAYRDNYYHGGILVTGVDVWYRRIIASVQHGRGTRGAVNQVTGELVTGPPTLPDEELAANRSDFGASVREHPLDDGFHRERSADWSQVQVPFLASGNWGGQGKHLRGAVEAFTRAASGQKWLEIHGDAHWVEFYTDYGADLQKRFLDHFLKGLDNGWQAQPRVHLRVRTPEGFVDRDEDEWPLARTRWTRLHLDPRSLRLSNEPAGLAGEVAFDALGDGVTFSTAPLEVETEVTGPVAARLFVSSSTPDADLFLVLRVFGPDDREVVFQGAVDPHTPVGQGWLRASHRRLDSVCSREERPYHTHDRVEPLTPGEVYELAVEVWPTSIVIPAGYRIALTVRGKDYEHGGDVAQLSHFAGSHLRGSGIYLHDDPADRPRDVFGGVTTIHAGGDRPSHLLLPVVPAKE
jgi:predicted acyl esterase